MTDPYRGRVRSRSPETSWDAAKTQTTVRVALVKVAAQGILAENPAGLTHEQIFDRYQSWRGANPSCPDATEQGVRSRVHELYVEGVVVDTGRTGRTSRGNKAVIWALNERLLQGAPVALWED